jgi:ribosomal protein S18 acetylase RimI-like enzyme
MDEHASLRPAKPEDFEFAWNIYSEAVKPHITPYLRRKWDDDEEKRRFATLWRTEKSSIILLKDKQIGWLAFDETANEIVIENAYIVPEFQRRGIGSKVFGELLERWGPKRKPVSLSVLKNAPHRPFFERLGFQASGENDMTVSFNRPASR